MKRFLILSILLAAVSTIHAQVNLPKRAEQRAKDKTGYKVDESVDKGIDSAFSKTGRAIGNLFKKKDKNNKKSTTEEEQGTGRNIEATAERKGSTGTTNNSGTAKNVNSATDFVPGGTVLFADNFEKDAMGDFPAQWNTNGSGKIVTIDGLEGRWLDVVHNCIITPVLNKPLPENSTIEFDLFLRSEGERSTPFIQFGLTQVRDILREDMFYKDRFFINLHRYTEEDGKTLEYGLKNDVIGNKSNFPLTSYVNKVLHVAIAVNKSRIRLYLDDNKIIDLPRALTDNMRYFFLNNNAVIPASETGMYISNVRIASAETDARSLLIKQLMEEGKAVTNDILFDVNGDKIRAASFSVINQFGEAMQKNPSLKIKITGHTDNDGADAANLALSQKRAAAVKNYITENFAVTGSRIQTDGKGESQPVASNTTADGKAKNRRVEFLKL
ncbi:OmpA family protein [Pseudobacter ginsenosidimutans]|uniref:OmpA family protein n=1 Tax=Pseudobacter ginsenosidimutans TaxID=661488 RepID=A0A4Q7MDQ3_9BACT|nr:OmpA family protein [Pseudobacter ginsenosidimutans]QEC45236.1 OmpA family protein [Pseudobacter ginsenosidimutans]RZS65503.1 OmpA family protein [Pseudobacter ginsenosidimutans]